MIRTSFFTFVLLLTCANSACAQSTTMRMVPSQSGKELIRENPSSAEGVVEITFGQVFKPGNTEYAQVAPQDLKGAPPWPTGFVAFHDLIYRVSTDATVSGEHAIVFAIPSIDTQAEFDRLEILHLQDDELKSSW